MMNKFAIDSENPECSYLGLLARIAMLQNVRLVGENFYYGSTTKLSLVTARITVL